MIGQDRSLPSFSPAFLTSLLPQGLPSTSQHLVPCSSNGAAAVSLDNSVRRCLNPNDAKADVASVPDGFPQDNMDFRARAISAAGAAFISAIIVNPLDVAKTRLQAQAAGVSYYGQPYEYIRRHYMNFNGKCPPVCPRGGAAGVLPLCPPACFQYNGTLDVFYKVIRQEGFARLWRGTNASLALAVPTVGIYLPCYDVFHDVLQKFAANNVPQLAPYAPLFAGSAARSLACIACSPIELARTRMQAHREVRMGVRPPGLWRTLFEALPVVGSGSEGHLRGVRALWTGVGAHLARDVPFSAICWSTLEPLRRHFIQLHGAESTAASILGANFVAGVIAGVIAAAATCPLDVAKTRRQIEKDPLKVMRMSTRQTVMQVWREGGVRGLFMGVGPRVGRAGPSVGIVVSFYEVMKYALHQTHAGA